jgi:hypothetical protein
MKIGKIINEPTMLVEAGQTSIAYYVIADTLDTNLYYDITSNMSWITIGRGFYDYLACRKQIMIRTATLGFDNLSLDEQKAASEHFAVGKASRDLVHSEAEQLVNWNIFVVESQRIRQERWVKAKGYISYQLAPVDSTDLALNTETLSKNFVEYGIEALAIDGVSGLYDWLTDVYPGKTYYNSTHKDNIMSILTTGTY